MVPTVPTLKSVIDAGSGMVDVQADAARRTAAGGNRAYRKIIWAGHDVVHAGVVDALDNHGARQGQVRRGRVADGHRAGQSPLEFDRIRHAGSRVGDGHDDVDRDVEGRGTRGGPRERETDGRDVG